MSCPEINDLEMEMLSEENINPKTNYPLVWKVGNKYLTFSDIEMLYRQAKRKAIEVGIEVD